MKQKVIKFPIPKSTRLRNLQGEFAVPCEVSERWLSLRSTCSHLHEGMFISLDVMTMGADDSPKKLCSLIVTRENLMEVLTRVKTKK